MQEHSRQSTRNVSGAAAEGGAPPRVKPKKRLTVALGSKLIKRIEKVLIRYSLIGDSTFFDPADFPWVKPLEDNWRAIRAELASILEERERLPNFQDISKDQRSLTQDDRWKTFFLYGYGYKTEENCQRCPETTRLIESVPGMQTAFFSILSPGKHIPSHRGPYKGVLRYHLGLMVPEPPAACRIRVGEDYRHWLEGKSLLFDDTYKHEVWNDTDGVRVVLFMDVLRPLRFPASALNKGVLALIRLSPFIQEARRNQNRWARGRYG
jgi:beta-hydroxylase